MTINKILSCFIIIPFILLGFYSFGFLTEKTIVNTQIFEILVFVYLINLFIFYNKKCSLKGFSIFIINIIYVFLSYRTAVLRNNAHVLDFLLIFKTFIYLAFLIFAINKKILHPKMMLKFINVIYGIFFAKYLICWIFNFRDRPSIYVENNFELMLISTLYLVRYSLTKSNRLKFLFFLGIIILLSMSRSAILMYAIIFTFVVKEKVDSLKWEAINKFIFSLTGLIFSFLLVFLVFANRGSSLEKTDRYMFMSVFFQETQDWNFFQYMTGAPSITPLSNDAVNSVSWLNELFSHSEDGSCYSVVLHSYILRVLFDHGIIGMICIIFFTYEILKLSHINKKIIWVTISIFMLNGLSVSSFNSVFFPVSMIFLMGTQYEKIHLKWN